MQITLKAARINSGLTQKEAAERLKISESTLYNYECGKQYPDVPIIQRIEKLYNISYNEIVFRPKNTTKP